MAVYETRRAGATAAVDVGLGIILDAIRATGRDHVNANIWAYVQRWYGIDRQRRVVGISHLARWNIRNARLRAALHDVERDIVRGVLCTRITQDVSDRGFHRFV
jgi:transcriptional regulator GlxA family with amidase domain